MKIDIFDRTNCTKCGCSLIGNPIPDDIKHLYGHASHFSRLVGQYDPKTQKIKAWECPECETVLKKGAK